MSEELIREMNDAVARQDLDAFVALCQADAVWEHNPGGGSLEEGTYRGRAEIKALFERILEGWDYMRVVPAETRETAAGVYRTRGQMHCKHPTTESEIVEPYEQELEFRDGLLVRGRMVFGS